MTGAVIQFLLLLSLAEPLFVNAKWHQSPEAYFLTESERAEWEGIDNDERADEFISAYHARRCISFRKELERRIALADELFSRPHMNGSSTLSGRILIVLGEPKRLYLEELWRDEITGERDSLLYSNMTPFGGGFPKLTSPERRVFLYEVQGGRRFVFEVDVGDGGDDDEMRTRDQRVLFELIVRKRAEESLCE